MLGSIVNVAKVVAPHAKSAAIAGSKAVAFGAVSVKAGNAMRTNLESVVTHFDSAKQAATEASETQETTVAVGFKTRQEQVS